MDKPFVPNHHLLPSRLSLSALESHQIHPSARISRSVGVAGFACEASPPIGNFTLPRRFNIHLTHRIILVCNTLSQTLRHILAIHYFSSLAIRKMQQIAIDALKSRAYFATKDPSNGRLLRGYHLAPTYRPFLEGVAMLVTPHALRLPRPHAQPHKRNC